MVAKLSDSLPTKAKIQRWRTQPGSKGRKATPMTSTRELLLANLINRRTFGLLVGCCAFLVAILILSQMANEPYHLWDARVRPFTFFWKRLRERRETAVPFCHGMLKKKFDIKNALKYMKNNAKVFIPTANFAQMEKTDCEVFRQASGYAHRPLSEKEARFPLAYSIMMHKDVEQVERLLRAIYMPQNYYCIHVDRKSPSAVHRAMRNIAQCFPNVFIATRLVDVRWGMFSMLQADFNCMKDLLRYDDWRYFINLTGQEFPLVSNPELVKDLKKLNNTNFIPSWRETREEFLLRTKYRWRNNRRTNMKKGKPPYNIVIMKGSLHNFLTRDFVHYVINNAVSLQFLKWLEDTWGPEETFFASLQYNKHLKAPRCHPASPRGPIEFDFRYLVWQRGKNVCAGKWVREVCVAGVGDLHKAMKSNGLFINKLHLSFQPLALDCLEEYHRNLTMRSVLK
ncbi:beta-1,3-galactosyl-O-glycosyl-glycoprotein beta-1,6-N-acetylglucosaminyltransferase 3-like [Lineus longissimus]|uniref:beta-1,3-galactosyl-O-glycosyl-glycoprotein beta-1,6-N-acetylglucosaminyltransferase 3-like n=1 Tax=Lineus longissimus TaxID=88925 RepID=UPI00315CAE39